MTGLQVAVGRCGADAAIERPRPLTNHAWLGARYAADPDVG